MSKLVMSSKRRSDSDTELPDSDLSQAKRRTRQRWVRPRIQPESESSSSSGSHKKSLPSTAAGTRSLNTSKGSRFLVENTKREMNVYPDRQKSYSIMLHKGVDDGTYLDLFKRGVGSRPGGGAARLRAIFRDRVQRGRAKPSDAVSLTRVPLRQDGTNDDAKLRKHYESLGFRGPLGTAGMKGTVEGILKSGPRGRIRAAARQTLPQFPDSIHKIIANYAGGPLADAYSQ